MSNKRLRNMVQNVALVVLTLSALFLLSRLPLLHNFRWSGQMQQLLSTGASERGESGSVPAEMFSSVHFMATGDSEYGRCGQLCVPAEDPGLQTVMSLFREAMGSAGQVGMAADATLRSALEGPGLYLELTAEGQLPPAALAVWLGEDVDFDQSVRAMALTAGEEDDPAALYLLDGEGNIWLYETALPASAVRSACDGFAPNGSCFAYETNYGTLSPYTVLVAEAPVLPSLQADLPAGYTAYNLLTALDFNAHTLSRYTESSGAEVVEESPCTLRISPDGTVSFTSRGEASSSLYRAAGETAGMEEYLAAGWRLAGTLTDSTGASPLRLRTVEEQPEGCVLRFRYQAEGVPVFFSDEGDALSVTFSGGQVTAFTYRCRLYTAQEESAQLLPPAMARAIAATYPGAGLTVGYEDSGAEQLTAQWLPR